MANRFSKAAKDAAEMTNKQLADELAAVTRLSREELNELLPTKNDKEKFSSVNAASRSGYCYG